MQAASSSSNGQREIELLQQLSLKDALTASQDEVITALRPHGGAETLDPVAEQAAYPALDVPLSSSSSSSYISSFSGNHDQHQERAHDLPQLLERDDILDHIFGFVGVKEWLYVGGVCRRWRDRYLSMCYTARASKDEHAFQTSYRCSFVTRARLRLAIGNGMQIPDRPRQANPLTPWRRSLSSLG
jgi:hypothetical protein